MFSNIVNIVTLVIEIAINTINKRNVGLSSNNSIKSPEYFYFLICFFLSIETATATAR